MTDSEGGFDPNEGGTDAGSGSPEPVDPELFDADDPAPRPVEPGSPTLENAVFVLLGVASMIALIVHLATIL